MLESGVHATIAGVIAALTIPSRPKLVPTVFTNSTRNLLDEFDNYPIATDYTMHENQKAIIQNLKDKVDAITSPAARLEHSLHLPVSLIIIPFFALANAGIKIDFSSITNLLQTPVALGVIFGLIGGKVIGIAGSAFLASKTGLAQLPENSTMSQVFGVAFLGGIGFTMSIFISDLAFNDNDILVTQAKAGILFASLVAGLIGYFWLSKVSYEKS
jgi:NhaA family Na+:H+ antiporter